MDLHPTSDREVAERDALRANIMASQSKVEGYCLSQPYDIQDVFTRALEGSGLSLRFIDGRHNMSHESLVGFGSPSLSTDDDDHLDGPLLRGLRNGDTVIVYNMQAGALPVGSAVAMLAAALQSGKPTIDFDGYLTSPAVIAETTRLLLVLNGSGCC